MITWLRRFIGVGTGYEIVEGSTLVPYSTTGSAGGAAFTFTCPPDKYALDRQPDFGAVGEFVRFACTVTTATLPDGRVLPTGWTGVVYQDFYPSPNPTVPAKFTVQCIHA
jgi:hypothetical protein